MGVPKFFRWLSERYPKILHRQTFEPEETTYHKYFTDGEEGELLPPLTKADPLSTCGLPPEIDNLYIDTNGVLHGCSHNNGDTTGITEDQVFRNVAYYLDRVISDIVKPKKLVYIAIDGVAPRAKLNQQRSRRYRGGTGESEHSIYEAFYEDKDDEHEETEDITNDSHTNNNTTTNNNSINGVNKNDIRLTGKFESSEEELDNQDAFHPNQITPGTEFFQKCTQHLEHWIQYKLSTDERWKDLQVIFSGPNTPGEGEHKIMDYIRTQRGKKDYDPNLKHAIMGQDADLIMLGLATHEPNMVIFREKVIFGLLRRASLAELGLDVYLHNCHFEWLHMSVLRDYLMYEFETTPAIPKGHFDRERCIQDFIFLTFLVGNDFLPSLPALDIGNEAFDLIFHVYKRERRKWLRRNKDGDHYLTKNGRIYDGQRLEDFLQELGGYEVNYYAGKAQVVEKDVKEEVVERKNAADREQYRKMLGSIDPKVTDNQNGFQPVMNDKATIFQPQEDELEEGFMTKIGSLLQSSITDEKSDVSTSGIIPESINDQDLKGRYYFDKFGYSPFDAEKHLALRKAYVEGLVWNLNYYFRGCQSWSWFYPYHYGPMLSDLLNLKAHLAEIKMGPSHPAGEPFKPFEQLMGNLPPSNAHMIPEPYRWLMTDESSPIVDFYPRSFTVDMNGKRWPWEAVALLPFVDSARLLEATGTHVKDHMLTEGEMERNLRLPPLVYSHNAEGKSVIPALETQTGGDDYFGAFECKASSSELEKTNDRNGVLEAKVLEGTIAPIPGFPTLTYAPIQSLWRRRVGLQIHGGKSLYRTALLNTTENLPAFPPIEVLAANLLGTTVYINYPHLTEAFVTEISNADKTFRGKEPVRRLNSQERELWQHTLSTSERKTVTGQGLPGTGGWKLPPSSILVSVRPLKEIKTLSGGTRAKVFAKFTLTLPLMQTIWSPTSEDPRTANLPYALEKDPFFVSKEITSEESLVKAQPILPSMTDSSNVQDGVTSISRSSSVLPTLDPAVSANILPPMESKRSFSSLPVSHLLRQGSRSSNNNGEFPRAVKPQGRRKMSTFTAINKYRPTSTAGNIRARIGSMGIALAVVVAASPIGGANASTPLGMNSGANTRVPAANAAYSVVDIDHAPPVPPLEFEHGTTTLSFKFRDGIICAVDSRASLGSFVGSKTVEKVLPISNHILGTMAGGAADCSVWIRRIKAEAQLFELENGYPMTVARASRLLSNALYQNRGAGLSIGTMIMGYDGSSPDPKIYYLDNTGVRIKGDMFSVGSGSTFALGILDKERKKDGDMSMEEAVALGIKAIRHATFRDAYSGGYINVYVITPSGWRHVFSEDIASTVSKIERQTSMAGAAVDEYSGE